MTGYLLRVLFSTVTLQSVLHGAVSLDCLSDQCSYGASGEPACVTSTSTATTITCQSGELCYTKRQYLKSPGYIYYFERKCKADVGRSCTEDIHYYTCEESCSTSNCNNGNGVPSGYDPLPSSTTTTTSAPGVSTSTSNPGRQCYSCSYVQSADASATYECVDGVTTSRAITCSSDRICVVKRVTSLATDRVNSFDRGCLPTSSVTAGCTKDVYFNTCTTTCSGHLCNTGTGIPDSETTTTGRSGGGSLKSSPFLFLVLLSCILSRVQMS
ncbi:uncharacterized protein LOC106171686 [Lingula anatina]|uniref:Uncharacterized protein LOC106171686 n=1 Tax=Lingula anatina TaxID=7574 RepID=A0A1S3JCH5_LINAN|nr:uncharacterized protein LOC106171686 [Lingula anatina]|eukprot:XP_013407584.1 uncharacterized protein LOC106171686 [Lingula anatina]